MSERTWGFESPLPHREAFRAEQLRTDADLISGTPHSDLVALGTGVSAARPAGLGPVATIGPAVNHEGDLGPARTGTFSAG